MKTLLLLLSISLSTWSCDSSSTEDDPANGGSQSANITEPPIEIVEEPLIPETRFNVPLTEETLDLFIKVQREFNALPKPSGESSMLQRVTAMETILGDFNLLMNEYATLHARVRAARTQIEERKHSPGFALDREVVAPRLDVINEILPKPVPGQ